MACVRWNSAKRTEAAKLEALRLAAGKEWGDIAAGRYIDIADDGLVDFVGRLGARAAHQGASVG